MGVISHPLSPCGRLGRRLMQITGRSCTHSTSLTCSQKGNGVWREWERKCTLRPKWNTRWQEVGRRPLKLTPGLCAGMASAIDPARDGRGGEPAAPRGPTDHADLLWARRTAAESDGAQPHCSESYHCSDSQSQLAAS
ncbi:uncharacterized protein AKAME5_002892500 [Lates japonicus]|uniref:Uncharacterized protein n=1 Tax=Lates japonicus TaxID=270547 RepID=A0AAD3MTN9_LATJO|nr:uncharacterized protein AKAME5_002892400 [Lates japonicus]GLD59347.1 uncharacterized protein AKAME5_002892500 [Lates japonicus]